MPSISKNIFWLSLSRIFAIVIIFFAYTQLFRYLGPINTGKYQFVLSYITIFGVVVDLGISQYVIKKISQEPNLAKRYFHNFLAAEIILAVVIYGAMSGFAMLRGFDQDVFHAILIGGIGMVGAGISMPFLSVLTAFQDLKRVAVVNLLSSLVNFSIIVLTIIFKLGIVFLAVNTAISTTLTIILYIYFIKRHIPKLDLVKALEHIDVSLLKKILIAALPFALLVSFSTIYNRIDVVLITKLLSYEQTGYYTAAYKFVDLMNFFPAVVSHSLYPAFASLMSKNAIEEVRILLERYLRFLIMIALPMGIGATILARQIISLVAGPEFSASAPVLSILVWAVVILFIYIVANALVVSQLTRFAAMITGANVVINIVGNLILLPTVGIKGAAYMTVFSELLQGAFYFYFIRTKITQFTITSLFAKPLIASALMGVVLWLLRDYALINSSQTNLRHFAALLANLGFLVFLGSLVYFATLYVIGFFQKDDTVLFKKFLGKGDSVRSN